MINKFKTVETVETKTLALRAVTTPSKLLPHKPSHHYNTQSLLSVSNIHAEIFLYSHSKHQLFIYISQQKQFYNNFITKKNNTHTI